MRSVMHPCRSARLGLLVLAVLIASVALAQWRGGGRRGNSLTTERYGVPDWRVRTGFERDSFVFARVRYSSSYYGRSGGGWSTDYRDADLNLSFRLHQLTSMQVDPEGKVLELSDSALFDYPLLYIVEPGRLEFAEDEIKNLRQYLLSGGFLLVDDFWGAREWDNLYEQMKLVFPDREPIELPLDHAIFHCVFPLKEKPQIPGVGTWLNSGDTYERDGRVVQYKGIHDDKGHMMVLICHNTDLGDGWEEEATHPDYFRQFSEKYAYPLAVNILFYTMTH